jgi:hypothetical protein
VLDAVATVMVEVAVPPAASVTKAGLKLTDAPGAVVAPPSATVPLKPLEEPTVTV